jgi:alpha-tubulin suppressor-like RCC1 family protein
MGKYIKILISLFICVNVNAADYYWVGGQGNWSDYSNHWATTSGGTTFYTSVPTPFDNVFFDNNSTSANDTVFVDIPAVCNNLKIDVFIKVFQNNNLTINGTFDFANGTLISNSNVLTINQFYSNYGTFRTFDISNSTVNITGSDTAWNMQALSLTFNQANSSINFNYSGNNMVVFNSGFDFITYENVTFSTPNIKLIDKSVFNTLTINPNVHLYLTTRTINGLLNVLKINNTLNANGNCTSPIYIEGLKGLSSTSQVNIDGNGNTFTLNFIRLLNTNIVSGTFTANNSIDLGNNTGWTINEEPSNGIVKWINGSGNWSDPTHWSTNCIPGPNDDVVFDNLSFSAPGQSVNVDIEAYCNSMNWTGVTNNPDLTGNTNSIHIKTNMTLDPNMSSSFTQQFIFYGSGGNITSSNVTLNGDLLFRGTTTSNWTLNDNLTSNAGIIYENGNLTATNKILTIDFFRSQLGTTRNLDFSSSTINLTGVDSTWAINPTNLTPTLSNSEIIVNHNLPQASIVDGGGISYNTFRLFNPKSIILNNNTFNLLEIKAGKSLSIESGTTQNLDSLIAIGNCDSLITIESLNPTGTFATINKTGYNILNVDYVNLVNINASVSTTNTATNSYGYNNTTGWVITNSGTGSNYYWVSDGGNWSDITHWQSPLGTPATCLPNIFDTVYFDNNSFSLSNQTVNVDVDAYFAKMDWTGSAPKNPILLLSQDIWCRDSIILNSSVTINNQTNKASIKFIPDANNSVFVTYNRPLKANVLQMGNLLSDTLTLNGDLKLDSLYNLTIAQGTFDSNNDSIFAGSLLSNGTNNRTLLLNNSYIELYKDLDFNNLVNLSAGTSHIFIKNRHTSNFYGNNLTFYNVSLQNLYPMDTLFVYQSNTFNDLELLSGLYVRIQDSQTQTLNGNLIAKGTCIDSIFIDSQLPNTVTNLTLSNNNTIEVCSIKDINVSSNNLTTLFSTDKGNNSGITFDNSPSSTPSFTTPFDQCLGNTTSFTNTSTAYSGNFSDLTFEWDFGDQSPIDNSINPTHAYTSTDLYYVTLTATYTNLCKETYNDSVRINHIDGQLTSNDLDLVICSGDNVDLTAISTLTADNYTFIKNGSVIQNTSNNVYSSANIANGDVFTLTVTLNGCTTSSPDTLTFTVNPLPNVILTSSDADNIICDGDSVNFTVTGADEYQFFINSSPVTFISTTNTFSTNTLVNGDTVKVIGYDTLTNCQKNGNVYYVFTVNPNPVPNMVSSDANSVICSGDAVIFTGSNATNYEFLINGTTAQGPNTTNTFTTSTLTNGDVVQLIGYDLGCGTVSVDSFNFIVNPIPNVTLTNNTGLSICAGDAVTFTASGASIYEFFVDGISVAGPGANPNYSTSALTNGQTVTVTGDALGCINTSSPQTFTVTTLPTVILTNSDVDTIICQYENVTFNASGANNYQFLLDGFPIGSYLPTSSYSTTTLNNGQSVSVMGEVNGCYNQSANVYTFTVKPAFAVNVFSSDADLTICEGETIDFTGVAGSGVSAYDLYDNGSLLSTNSTGNFSISTLTTGTHLIAVSATKNGCTYFANDTLSVLVKPNPIVSITSTDADQIICENDTVIFYASGASTYDFLIDGFSQGASSVDSLIIGNLSNGQTVSVTGTTNGCSTTSSSFTFTVNAIPNVTLTSDDIDNIICEGQTINFTSAGATNYEFFIDNVSQGVSVNNTLSTTFPTSYSVYVIGETNNCYNSVPPINVTINPTPIISTSISDADTTICQGENVTVTATGAGTYQLLINGVATSSPSTQNIFNISTLNNNDVVTVQGYSVNQCSGTSSDTFTFTVKPNPNVNLTSSDADSTICEGELVNFTATGATTYSYYINNNLMSTNTTFSTNTLQNGDFVNVIGDLNGCTSTSGNIQFTVYAYPITSIITTDNDTTICVGDSISFVGLGAFDYEFYVNGVLVQGPSVTDTLSITTLNNGDLISVKGINNGCGTFSDTIPVNVISYPNTILVSSDIDNEICYGEQVTFTTNGATSYEFYINNLLQGNLTNNPVFTTSTLNHNDTISAIGYNGECATPAPQIFIMTVHTLPLTLTSADNNLICQGDAVTYTSSGADSYEFFVDGTSVQGPSTNAVFTSTSIQNGQTITVNGFSNTTGCTQQAQTSHIVTVMTNPIVTALNSTTICEGDSVVLVSSSPTWNQWFFNSSAINGANDTLYNAYDNGDYYVQISLGGNGNVIGIGNNAYGQLGDSTNITQLYKVDTKNLQNITSISSGENHNIALDASGIVYTWGKNDFGQIGDGTFTSTLIPYVTNVTSAKGISAGHRFSVVVLQDGSVITWGQNDYGQLGQGNTSTTNFPFTIPGLNNVASISAGKNHCLALLNDGTLMAWGDNQYGQLGTGNFINSNTPIVIPSISNIAYINCGANHSIAVDSLGRLYVWGNNAEGQLGISGIQFSNTPVLHQLDNIKMADGGLTHTLALTQNNQLFSWGNNAFSQLGDGTTNSSYSPILITTLDAVDTVFTNFNYNYVLKKDQSVWSWGENTAGQLGTGNTNNQNTPTYISTLIGSTAFGLGKNHTVFLTGFSNSCPSNTITVSVNPSPDVIVSMNNGTLSVNPLGNSYQWFINGIVIPNATSSTFTPVTAGYYTCEVTFTGGCSSLSNEYPFHIVGIDENTISGINIYPNPTLGEFIISGNLNSIKEIVIYNSLGQQIKVINLTQQTESYPINLDVETGIYYIHFINNLGVNQVKKLVIE